MVRNSLAVDRASFLICFLMVIFLLDTFFHAAHDVKYLVFLFDPRIAPLICDEIKQQATRFESEGIYNPCVLIQQIPEYFSLIKSMELVKHPGNVAIVSVIAFKPILEVNNDKVLIENKELIPTNHYAPYVYEVLPKITMLNPPACFSVPLMNAVNNCIAQKVFDHYTFHVIKESEWYLRDNSDIRFMMCCNVETLPFDDIQNKYNQLKKHIGQTKYTKTRWVADVRFHDQIILSMDKGGRYG